MKKILSMFMIFSIFLFGQPVVAQEQENNLAEEIIYNIMVDRFNIGHPEQSDQVDIQDFLAYHGGDIIGITNKLDHIQQHGFTTITISSVFENAEKGYHGYWIEDFYAVEEEFGSLEELKTLVEEAHKRDLKVVLELVTNYASKTHEFVTDSTKTDWFRENTLATTEATTWLDDVVMFNQDNPEVQEYLIDVAEFWLTETKADGFKLHAADQSSPAFLEQLVDAIYKIKPDAYVLAGVLDEHADLEDLHAIEGINAVEQADLLETLVDTFSQVDQPVSNIYEAWETNGSYADLSYIDNQYTKRFTHAFSENERNKVTAWKLALTYLYTTPGIPSIYQGSEVAMIGEGFPENQYLVLFNHNDKNLTEFFEKIASLRTEFPALQHGDFEQVGENGAMSLFKRTYNDETMYIAINNDSVSRAVHLTDIDTDLQLRGVIGDNTVRANDDGEFIVGIEREAVEVYMVQPNQGFNWWFIGFVVGVFILFVIFVNVLSRKSRKQAQANKKQ